MDRLTLGISYEEAKDLHMALKARLERVKTIHTALIELEREGKEHDNTDLITKYDREMERLDALNIRLLIAMSQWEIVNDRI